LELEEELEDLAFVGVLLIILDERVDAFLVGTDLELAEDLLVAVLVALLFVAIAEPVELLLVELT
jgi:hypothetical protein